MGIFSDYVKFGSLKLPLTVWDQFKLVKTKSGVIIGIEFYMHCITFERQPVPKAPSKTLYFKPKL